MRRGVRSLLEQQKNWRVVGEAADGRSALRLISETKPDIVVIDYMLPNLNGVDVAREIKQNSFKAEVLLFTTIERESAFAEALHAGVRGYLLKSESAECLVEAVEAVSRKIPYFSGVVNERLLSNFIERAQDHGTKSVLTPREREIVQLVAEGQSNKQAAYTLGISIKTVESHREAAMAKLHLRSTAELVRYAVRNDMVLP